MPADAIGDPSQLADRTSRTDRTRDWVGFCRLWRLCGRVQGVDEVPRGGWPATLGTERFGVAAAQVAVLLQQGKGRVQVGGFAEASTGGGTVGVAAGELLMAGAGDPVQQPAGVVDAGVGAHQVEGG